MDLQSLFRTVKKIKMNNLAINKDTKKITDIAHICDTTTGKVLSQYKGCNYLCIICNAPVKPYSRSNKNSKKYTSEHFQHTGSKSEEIAKCPKSYFSAFRSTIKSIITPEQEVKIRVKDKQKITLNSLNVLEGGKRFDIKASYLDIYIIYIRFSYYDDRLPLEDEKVDGKLIIEILINRKFIENMREKHFEQLSPEETYFQLFCEFCGRRISKNFTQKLKTYYD